MSTPDDPFLDDPLATHSYVQAMMTTIRDRLRAGEFVDVPKQSTATVSGPGSGDVVLIPDEPVRPDGKAPSPLYARVTSHGYAHPGERVQVHHEPPAGHFVVGPAAGGGGWVGEGEQGGWTGVLTDEHGTAVFNATEHARWRRYGQLCAAEAVIRFGTVSFNQGVAPDRYLINPPFAPLDQNSGGDLGSILGDGYVRHTGGGVPFFVEQFATTGQLLMLLTADLSAVGTGNPWTWDPSGTIILRLWYEVAQGQ